ncbi:MAG: AsmA family protein, partial [Cyclobacteriaceae bacterium]
MFKKILLYFGLAITFILVAGSLLTYLNQDRIVQKFITEVNKNINTPIKAKHIGLSLWEKFPQLSVNLHQVWIQESLAQSTDTLAEAANIYFTFGLWDILRGDFVIDQVHLENAKVDLFVTEDGHNNFTIITRDTTKLKKEVAFKIDQINLKDVAINYQDRQRKQDFKLLAHDMQAGLEIENDLYKIALLGNVTSEKIEINKKQYFKDKPLSIDGSIDYHYNQRLVNIYPTKIGLNKSSFLVEGSYQSRPVGVMDIAVKGEDTDIQTVLSLLSEAEYKKYEAYRSDGDLYFEGSLKGQLNDKHSPAIDLKFGCKEAAFYHPNYKKGVKNVNLTGHYYNPSIKDLSTAELTLENVTGELDGRSFQGNLTLRDFTNYEIACDLDAVLNVNSLLQFYPIENLQQASGFVDLDIHMEGIVNAPNKKSSQNFVASGEINLDDLQFDLKQNNLPFRDFN